jgi:nitrate reductase gamma subunit
MSVLLFLSLSMFIGTMADRYWLMRAGENAVRWDNLPARLRSLLVLGFGQKRLLYKRWAGLMHVVIFAGFLVVSIRTVTLFGRGFDLDFHLPLLGGGLGHLYAALKDTFAVLVIVAILYAVWRRLVVKPSRLHLSFEALLILMWIAALMVTDFLHDAALFNLQPDHPERTWAWAGNMLTGVFAGADPAVVEGWFRAMFWVHVVLLMAFLNLLPFGKHFHVLTALPATFLRRLTPTAALTKMEFEGRETFGVGKLEDFS